MGRPCTLCSHSRRDEIDVALLSIGPTRFKVLMAMYGLSKDAIFRHKRDHIARAIAAAPNLVEVSRGESLLAQVNHLREKSLAILQQAERAGQLNVALGAIREVRECLTLLGKLLGSFEDGAIKIDARTQIIANLNRLSVEELRALAVGGSPTIDEYES